MMTSMLFNYGDSVRYNNVIFDSNLLEDASMLHADSYLVVIGDIIKRTMLL